MTRRPWLPAALLLHALTATTAVAGDGEPALTVTVDSSRHEVVLTAGPFDLPSMAGHLHDGHDGMMTKFSARFDWPVEAMGRGFTFELRDAGGGKVSQRALHHMQIINNSRRQLLLPLRERIIAVGRETKTHHAADDAALRSRGCFSSPLPMRQYQQGKSTISMPMEPEPV